MTATLDPVTPPVLAPTSPPTPAAPPTRLPTHKDLPDKDGEIVENDQELPQNILLTGCLRPWLQQLRPDGRFKIGSDNGIYWRITEPPLQGCKAPDFFVVLGVEPTLHGEIRRSYVMWQEVIAPSVVIEYVSGDGAEEHDQTPFSGKFWVYEQAIRAPYYVIFDGWRRTLEAFRLVGGVYEPMAPNERGRYPVPPLGVEFGMWDGVHERIQAAWLRPWSITTGELLPSFEETVDQERQRADAERQRAERLAERLRQLGVDPDAV